MSSLIIILATGVQGTAAARELRQAGYEVHALVRNRHVLRAVALEQIGVRFLRAP